MLWARSFIIARQQQRFEKESVGEKFNPPPLYIVLDEWLRTLKVCAAYKLITKEDIATEIINLIEEILEVGREEKVFVWLMPQDHQCQNAKINKGYRKQFAIIVLGRKGLLLSLEEAIVGQTSIVNNTDIKESLFREVRELSEAHPQSTICYSNIQGHEILLVPYLPDIKRKQIFSSNSNNVNADIYELIEKAEAEESNIKGDVWEAVRR